MPAVIPPPQTQEAAQQTALPMPATIPMTAPPPPLRTVSTVPINRNMPMKNLPPIPRSNSVAEAQANRQAYNPPNIIPGEMVYYRRKGGNDEELGFVLRSQNKSFTLKVALNNNVFTEVNSVDYWDHTEEQPTLTGDPMAGHHSYGTFRRTPFGKMVLELVAKLAGDLAGESGGAGYDAAIKKVNDSTATALLGMSEELDQWKIRMAGLETKYDTALELIKKQLKQTEQPKPTTGK